MDRLSRGSTNIWMFAEDERPPGRKCGEGGAWMTLMVGEPRGAYEAVSGMVARVAIAAHAQPSALAVASRDRHLSYGELWLRALAVSAELRESGVSRGDAVGLCLPRSMDLVVGARGILAAGGCYVALDPSYPDVRLAFMLIDSGAKTVVTTP